MSETLYENLTITNSFIFGKVMQEPSLCKHFLEKLLGIKIQKINYPEREKEIGIMPDGHDVRLDVYADDMEDGLRLGDGAYRIFLCLTPHFEETDIDEDIKAFLFYISGVVKNDNGFIRRLDEELQNVKNNKLWRKEYMKYELDLMMMRRMGYEEGKSEATEAAQLEINAMKELQGATEKRAQDAEQKVSVLMGRLSELGYHIDPEKILESAGLIPCK